MKFSHFLSFTFRSIGVKTRIAGLVLGTLFIVGWLLTRPPTDSWVDMARSHNGQEIEVHRVVEHRFWGGWQRSPTQFSLKFINPANGKRVSWEGEQYVHPVLLDVVNGIPWLVINSNLLNSELKHYGCPEIPYVFLSYKQDRWIPVSPAMHHLSYAMRIFCIRMSIT